MNGIATEVLTGSRQRGRHQWVLWLLASAILVVVALPLPFTTDSIGPNPTWLAIIVGWLVAPGVWLAAPLLLASWVAVCSKHAAAAILLASLGLGLLLPFLLAPEVPYGWGDYIFPRAQVPGVGFFFGVCAIIATLVASIQRKRALAPDVPPTHPFIWVLVPAAVLLPSMFVTLGKYVQPKLHAAGANHAAEEATVRRAALAASRSWVRHQLDDAALREIAHARPGVVPKVLEATRAGRQVRVVNRHAAPVQIDIWFSVAPATGPKVVCRYVRGEKGRAGRTSPVILAPGESAVLEASFPLRDLEDTCRGQAVGPLQFAVKTADGKRVLFLSDGAFFPAPPPRAEGYIQYWR